MDIEQSSNRLLNDYHQGRLPASLLLVTNRLTANRLVDELIKSLQLNPADYRLFSQSVTIKIADARAIRQFAELTRFTSPIKLIYLADAAQLTHEAANALLKILEEPPAKTHFILATDRPDKLLPTVRSRCQTIHLHSIDENSINETISASIALPTDLVEAFQLSQQLAATDQPLESYFQQWLRESHNLPRSADWVKRQAIILDYLEPAQTPVNRRLLLDNFFLDLYNTD